MLYANIDENGVLLLRATERIESYALQQWNAQRARGKATIKIECGATTDIVRLCKSLAKDATVLAEWHRMQKCSAVITDEEDAALSYLESEKKL